MRGSVYAQIGGMDEGYIMYSEETDLCKRAVNAGWKVVYLGSAQIIHHGGKSTEQASTRAMLYFHKSKIRYFHKHHGWGQAGVVRSVLILSFAQQTVMEALKGAIGHKRALRQQRVSAYRQVIRGLLTP
jgi:GT2 family glycosyltransferase